MRSARLVLATMAVVVATAAGGVTIGPPEPAEAFQAADRCPGKAFPWGGDCWSAGEGTGFADWLRRHGSGPERFERNYPELAAVFREPWPPPPPYWRTCLEGRACAQAVIGHIFGGDISYEMAIVGCETGWTYDAHTYGDAGERGWWQIHPVHFGWLDEGRLYDVRYNTAVAYRLSEHGSDFSPWTCA